ncbi:unnamed protein product [Moneuplotes crassus]|uniref:Uncharacterized protein n=2 Tax=Euplotes crassus TaxID=5936 RepID=A0AAD1Y178_EUPCR|nr:unnamed protein product [Moneuplotes crassus]
MTDLKQNLPKIAPMHNTIHEKQKEIVKLVKNFEIEPVLHCNINKNIPGLRQKSSPFVRKPASHRWYRRWHSFERNGVMNWGLTMNWTRLVFPCVFIFYSFYMFEPTLHGSVYINEFNMYQYESVYAKMNWNKTPPMMQTINRVA